MYRGAFAIIIVAILAAARPLQYATDTFDGDVASFWVNGDLVVSPVEQVTFLRRLVRYELPLRRSDVDAVLETFRMPSGRITNASGVHDFALAWPAGTVVRAKTGDTNANGERVSGSSGTWRAPAGTTSSSAAFGRESRYPVPPVRSWRSGC